MLRVALDEGQAQGGTWTSTSGGPSPVCFGGRSPSRCQGRRPRPDRATQHSDGQWRPEGQRAGKARLGVSAAPAPVPTGPRTRASAAKLPGLPGNATSQHRVPGLVEQADSLQVPHPRRPLRLSPRPVAWLLHTPGTCASAVGGHLFPARAPSLGAARAVGWLPRPRVSWAGAVWAEQPLPMRGQKHCPRRDSRAPLRTHRACPAGRPAQVSIAIPPGPELLPGHMLLVPRLAVTRVFVGGWVPDPRSWLIGRRNCSGRWPGLSLHQRGFSVTPKFASVPSSRETFSVPPPPPRWHCPAPRPTAPPDVPVPDGQLCQSRR